MERIERIQSRASEVEQQLKSFRRRDVARFRKEVIFTEENMIQLNKRILNSLIELQEETCSICKKYCVRKCDVNFAEHLKFVVQGMRTVRGTQIMGIKMLEQIQMEEQLLIKMFCIDANDDALREMKDMKEKWIEKYRAFAKEVEILYNSMLRGGSDGYIR